MPGLPEVPVDDGGLLVVVPVVLQHPVLLIPVQDIVLLKYLSMLKTYRDQCGLYMQGVSMQGLTVLRIAFVGYSPKQDLFL